MERLANLINAIHDARLFLLGTAALLGCWLLVNQLMALLP